MEKMTKRQRVKIKQAKCIFVIKHKITVENNPDTGRENWAKIKKKLWYPSFSAVKL